MIRWTCTQLAFGGIWIGDIERVVVFNFLLLLECCSVLSKYEVMFAWWLSAVKQKIGLNETDKAELHVHKNWLQNNRLDQCL